MIKTTDAVQILNRKFGNDAETRQKIAEESTNIQVSELIYKARTQKGLTQKQLADLIGTKQPVIARLEDADYDGHSLKMLQKIAVALNQKISIHFIEPEEVIRETSKLSVPSFSDLLLRKLDGWIQAGWQTFQELNTTYQLPQLQYANARSFNDLELEGDELKTEILAAEEFANNDPTHPLASVRLAKKIYDLGRPLILAFSVSPSNDPELINVMLQVRSLGDESLPNDLKMILLDEQGKAQYFTDAPDEVIGSQSDGKTKAIYLPFQYNREETFGLEISRGEQKIYEKFSV